MENERMSRGRQRVDMKKMENESNLQVTFSKRRAGLFKKASEICTLTGSELAVVVFSPGNKAYSFGSPSVGQILEKYETQAPHIVNPPGLVNEAQRRATEIGLNQEFRSMEDHIDTAKKRNEELANEVKTNQIQNWWEAPIDELSVEQLETLKIAYEELDKRFQIQAQKGFFPGANFVPDFNISGPSVNNAFPAYDFQPPPPLPSPPAAIYQAIPPPPPPPPPPSAAIHQAIPPLTEFHGLNLSSDNFVVEAGSSSAVDHQEPFGSGTNPAPYNEPNAPGWWK